MELRGYTTSGSAQRNTSLLYRWHVDLPLLAGIMTLTAASLMILYSSGGQDLNLIYRQILRFLMAFVIMFIMAQIAPHHFQRWSPWLYGIGLILLVVVLLAGEVGKGAQRWLDLGLFRFQPSEMMKVAVPMMVAWYFTDQTLPPRLSRIAIATALIILPVFLVFKQPDLGTAILVGSAGVFVLMFAGLYWRWIILIAVVMSSMAPFFWNYLHDYQKQRVLTFLNPENDPLGSGYHIIQSKIAIGSGGIYGKGWLNGTQSQLDFLPERSTDFIFAAFAEEFGFIGVLLLMSLYLFIVLRGLYIAAMAQDTFSRLLAGSLIMTFFIYVFVNIGMVTGLLPVVGLPLPLISFGGTSVVTLLAGFGILMSIHTHRKLLPT